MEESMQKDPAGKLPPTLFCPSEIWPTIRFWPSGSWPTTLFCPSGSCPTLAPDAVKPKQQVLARETRALVPAVRARATATKVFMMLDKGLK